MKKTALFAGTFDPYTIGHHSIVTRAMTMFDKIIIAIGRNAAKRQYPRSDRCADICAHYYVYRLAQSHKTRVDKADNHDRGRGGRLDHHRDHSAHNYAEETVGGELFKNLLHSVTGCSLETVAHHLHAVQEQAEAAQQGKDVFKFHSYSPFV